MKGGLVCEKNVTNDRNQLGAEQLDTLATTVMVEGPEMDFHTGKNESPIDFSLKGTDIQYQLICLPNVYKKVVKLNELLSPLFFPCIE